MSTDIPPFEEIWQPLTVRSAWQDVIDAQAEVRQLIKQWEAESTG